MVIAEIVTMAVVVEFWTTLDCGGREAVLAIINVMKRG